MLLYERVVIRGRTLKRKDAGSSRGGGRLSKRRWTDVLFSAVRSPPVSAPLIAWPVRDLKRYLSWDSQLQQEPILQASLKHRQVRFEQDSACCGLCIFTFRKNCLLLSVAILFPLYQVLLQ